MKNIDKVINLAVLHSSYKVRKKNAKRLIKYLSNRNIENNTKCELMKKFYIASAKKIASFVYPLYLLKRGELK